jgi:hypothetical protein
MLARDSLRQNAKLSFPIENRTLTHQGTLLINVLDDWPPLTFVQYPGPANQTVSGLFPELLYQVKSDTIRTKSS